jgi:hypothetical protein
MTGEGIPSQCTYLIYLSLGCQRRKLQILLLICKVLKLIYKQIYSNPSLELIGFLSHMMSETLSGLPWNTKSHIHFDSYCYLETVLMVIWLTFKRTYDDNVVKGLAC